MTRYALTVYGKTNQLIETLEIEQDELGYLRSMLDIFRHQWKDLYLAAIDQDYGNVPATWKRLPEFQKLNGVHQHTQHSAIKIFLANETAITCRETGISASIKLGSQYGTHLEWLHPFSIYENVNRQLRQVRAFGKLPHQHFNRNELAGILISVLKHRKLLRAKDFISANLYLQKASDHTLSLLINFAESLSGNSEARLPSLSLLDVRVSSGAADYVLSENLGKTHAEIQLLNWRRDVIAAQENFSRSKTAPQERKAKSVKVYKTDKTAQEAKEFQETKSKETKLLGILKERYKGQQGYSGILTKIGFNIETAKFLTKPTRQNAAAEIRSKFPQSDKEAWELAALIAGMETSELEKDLLSEILPSTGKKEFKPINLRG